jgi:integrase
MAIRHRVVNGQSRWDVRLRGPDGRQTSTTFDLKRDAQRFERQAKEALDRGRFVRPSDTKVTLAKVAARWQASDPGKRLTTSDRDKVALEKHILPALGSRAVGTIRQGDVQAAVNEWAKHLAPSTVARTFSTLRAVLTFAVDRGLIDRAPTRKIKLPKDDGPGRLVLTAADVNKITTAIDEHFRPLVVTIAGTGIRLGEATGLRVGSLDIEAGVLRVVEQRSPDGTRSVPPKSRAGKRTITLPAHVIEVLRPVVEAHAALGADALVFVGKRGAPLGHSNFRERAWKPATKAAGVPWATPHDLRRWHATQLVLSGVDPKTAQARLGHSNIVLTLDVYARATRAGDEAAASAIGAALSA